MNDWYKGKSSQWISKDLIKKVNKYSGKTFSDKVKSIIERIEKEKAK